MLPYSTALQVSAFCSPLSSNGFAYFEGILAPGTTETDIDKQVFKLTASQYGTRKHWHQRLPRIGQNTIHPIYDKVPDLVLKDDDIVYVDLGPVFGDIEADFARTYVLGKLHGWLSKSFAKTD